MVKFRKIRIIPKINKKHKVFATTAAVIIMASVFGISSSYAVNAQESDSILMAGETTTETTTGEDKKEEKKPSNQMDADTTRIGFWEWEEVTTDNIRTLMSDQKFHASMIVPCYAENSPAIKSGGVTFSPAGTYTYDWNVKNGQNNLCANVNAASIFGTDNFVPYCKYSNQMTVWSTYADREHIFYGNVRTDYGYYDDFPMLDYNPENSAYRKKGYYGLDFDNMQHSLSYYFSAAKSMYVKQDTKGYSTGMPSSYFKRSRFFTFGNSMGVPFFRGRQIDGSNKNVELEISIPNRQVTNAEAAYYNPSNFGGYYLYGASVKETGDHGYEPILNFRKGAPAGVNDYIHMSVAKWSSDKNKNIWMMVMYNDTTDNDLTYDDCGMSLSGGQTDMNVMTYVPYKDCEWIMTGAKRPAGISTFKWYVGTPHMMTALKTQTIKDGKLMALKGGAFISANDSGNDKQDGDLDMTDGYIIQKDKVITIDGGTLTVGTNLINNGKIVIKNGGTLLVKSGGCISPFMENTLGNIECNGGNIIIMEGGRIYSLTDKADLNNSATLKLIGGSTLINYGGLAVTRATIDKGSKIENRNKAVLYAGVNRKDELVFLDKCTLNKSNMQNLEWISSDSSGSHDTSSYLKKGYGLEGVVDNKPTVVLEKTSTAVTLNPKNTSNTMDMTNDSTIDIIVPKY
ncbi:MAG: hypothetical protein K6F60_01640 [Eubacterium sp.]|nr:hypothetical protein [Eubacterium sp.]